MKAIILGTLIVSASLIACAQQAGAQKKEPLTDAEKEERRNAFLAYTGGLIKEPQKEGPVISFINAQETVPGATLQTTVDAIHAMLRFPVALRSEPAGKNPLSMAASLATEKNVAALILITEAENFPSLLVAPESKWVIINVNALKEPTGDTALLAERMHKEMWRAFAYVMGAANSNYETCLMKPVFSVQDLDALKVASVCPEPLNKILAQSRKLGLAPIRTVTYRKAVEEGWAPAPTNDAQKAICEEVKAKKDQP